LNRCCDHEAESGRIELFGGQTGDGVDQLSGAVGFALASALDLADGGDARPVLVEAGGQFGAHGDAAGLDAAVGLLDGLGAPQVWRVAPLL
jgi:hypothetical protein